jgi:hypothetical protein
MPPVAILSGQPELPRIFRMAGRSNTPSVAAHQSSRTTKLYDRTKDDISLAEVE